MPYRLETHVLTVDAKVIHKIDTANPANLYSMWTVFSRCADSVEQGRRLENLSWRLWQKEQLLENEKKTASAAPCTVTETTTSPQNIPSDTKLQDVPQLSGSVESLADDESLEFTSVSAPLEIARPRIRRQDSSTAAAGRRDRHTSSDDFEKMITSIVKDKEPLSAPTAQTKLPMAPQKDMEVLPQQTIYRSGSTTTESQSPSKSSDLHSEASHPSPEMAPRTTVVRGFSPSQNPIPHSVQPRSHPSADTTLPLPKSSPAPKVVRSGKQPVAFALGGASYSSSEQGQSVEARQPVAPTMAAKKNATFKFGGSSEEEGSLRGSLKSSLQAPRPNGLLTAQKKQASFSNHVTTHEPDNAIDSDSEADYIDESAIDDDDDSSDWEDSIEDSGKSSVDEKYFQRVDSRANLTSRRSLITLMLAQSDDRAKKLGNQASQSTSAIPLGRNGATHAAPTLAVSPNDSDDAPLMMKGARQSTLKPIKEIPRSNAQPIANANHGHAGQAALSPRTTRRNMLATELTESLRRHLLWERSQKSSTANAVLKRRHTSHDVANLKQYPERPCMKKSEDANASSFNQFFSKESFEGYHAKGW